MAMRPLKEFCEMFTGFPISSRDFAEAGDCFVVQVRDVSPNRLSTHLKKTDMPNINPEKLLRAGDVLFKSRGLALSAYALTELPHSRVIVTNSFIVLRPSSEVLPRFLAWALNNLQSELKKFIQKSVVAKVILIRDLKEVEFPIPDIASQQKVISAHDEIEDCKAKAIQYLDAVSQRLCISVLEKSRNKKNYD